MKTREEHIAFTMNYCQHYTVTHGWNGGISCAKGQVVNDIQDACRSAGGTRSQPCIGGHELADPIAACPRWLRKTREMGEARADSIEAYFAKSAKVGPVVAEWRKKKPIGKQEIIECPACKGRLHLSQAASNGHVHGKCETKGCVSWME